MDLTGSRRSSTHQLTFSGNNGAFILIEDGSLITGNVDILVSGAGSTLQISDSEVNGNVQTQEIDSLTITNSNINGNILSTNDGTVTIRGNTVNGNVDIVNPISCNESSNSVNGNNSGCPP